MASLNDILEFDSIMIFGISLPVIFFWFLFFYRRRKAIKCYFKYLFFFWYLIVIAILGLPLCLRHPVDCRSMWIFAKLIAPCSWFLGIKWEFRHGSKLIPHNQSAVCIANHQSMYDIVGLLLIWKTFSMRCGTIARNLFFWIWPVGLAMWMGGIIFIKRQSGSEETKKYFNEVARKHFEKNEKLWVFVEGTRNKSTKQLLPFKKGAFIAAIQHQVPIQPFVFSPFYFIDLKNRRFDSGKIIVEIMDPIPTKGLTENDLDDLVAKAYTLMSKKYEDLKDEIRKYTKNEVHFD